MNSVVNILLIEDDVLDQMAVQRVLDKKDILYRLKIAKNGEEALLLLAQNGNDIFTGHPDIILLDLSMPKRDGFEFLTTLKGIDALKDIKVFVLTTSDEKDDKERAMSFNISGYITKPLKLESPSTLDAFNLMIDLMNLQIK
jgi:CheY-like chemotaxis protein